ncbi:MAG: prolyl oligopeptidase family serine peptidase [Candidatus Marinimicrobia bacterium]|nr:prolyl oligopeptidase family serine peptidase [Candidatus Neomarinimicrobiota bacterium]MCF7904616.1 prolyl oligopeptidase family serine peptidase [Candidatus Neomarinimicrobiota bacterium]
MRPAVTRFVLFLLLLSPSFAEILHLKIPSAALVDSTNIIIATPSTFQSGSAEVYPFIIMLHGWAGDETQWEQDADLQALADQHNILLVLPDGGYDGWWQDTDLLPGRDYDTHINKELKPWVIEAFNGSPDPQKQGVLGLSMGGYGAFLQVFTHPGEYAAASALSGVMDLIPRTDRWGLKLTLGEYVENKARWSAHNPIEMVETIDLNIIPPLQLICGRDDFVFSENVEIVKKLQNRGFEVEFLEEEGRHSHDFWKTHVGTSVAFVVSKMQR